MADNNPQKSQEQLAAEKMAADKLAREKTQMPAEGKATAVPSAPNLTRDSLELMLVGRYQNDNPSMNRDEAERLAKKRALEMIP